MATTAKLGMRLIEGSDIVDPNVINDNFKKVDTIANDYIVEQGTSGEWWYRKWNSGRAECGIDHKAFSNVRIKTHLGGSAVIYASPQMQFPAYPFTFVGDPLCDIAFKYNTVSDPLIFVLAAKTSTTTRPPTFALCAFNEYDTIGTAYMGCHVRGRWK